MKQIRLIIKGPVESPSLSQDWWMAFSFALVYVIHVLNPNHTHLALYQLSQPTFPRTWHINTFDKYRLDKQVSAVCR